VSIDELHNWFEVDLRFSNVQKHSDSYRRRGDLYTLTCWLECQLRANDQDHAKTDGPQVGFAPI